MGLSNLPSAIRSDIGGTGVNNSQPVGLNRYTLMNSRKPVYGDLGSAINNPSAQSEFLIPKNQPTPTYFTRDYSDNPNLQNIPARTKTGQQIRASFIPELGYKLLTADYAQIELRWLANESGDPFMRSIYDQGKDIHVATTLEMYGYPSDTDTKTIPDFDSLRRGAKTINFGIVYGLSDLGLQSALSLSGVHKKRHECKTMIKKWFATYPYVEKLISYYKRICDKYAMTWTAFCRPRLIPEIRSTFYRVRSEGYRKAGNHPIQGSAGDLMKIAARNLHDYFQNQARLDVYHNMLIHDESLNEVPENKDTKAMLDAVMFIMESAVQIQVPIIADGKVLEGRWVK
jgi:DNA polymerase-1